MKRCALKPARVLGEENERLTQALRESQAGAAALRGALQSLCDALNIHHFSKLERQKAVDDAFHASHIALATTAGASLLARLAELEAECEKLRKSRDDYSEESRSSQEYIRKIGRLLECADGDDTPEIRIASRDARLAELEALVAGLEQDRERLKNALTNITDWSEMHFELCECRGEDQFTCMRCKLIYNARAEIERRKA